MRRFDKGLLAAILFLACVGAGAPDRLKYRVRVDDGYNALFARTEGWTGGDVASTVTLSPESTLWLFGDSWVGRIAGNRHLESEMINNAAAIQHGKAASPGGLTFYFGSKDGKPAPLFVPPDGRGFFWPTRAGIVANGRLYMAAARVFKKENDPAVFAFETQGNFLLVIANPLDEPERWQVEMREMPFFSRDAAGTEIDFGAPQFVRDGFVHIYGVEYVPRAGDRFMLLGRAPERQMTDFSVWEFYAKGSWQKDFKRADRLCDRFGAEFSVSFQPFLKKYVAVYSEMGLSDRIMLRTADRPEGPWGPPEVIYRTPETRWDKSYFCYAAKGHPELSGDKDLLVSYVCNSTDFWKMAADARIYRPKFIRIEFAK